MQEETVNHYKDIRSKPKLTNTDEMDSEEMELSVREGIQSHKSNETHEILDTSVIHRCSGEVIPETDENGDEGTCLMRKDNVVSLHRPPKTDPCGSSENAKDIHTKDENETSVGKTLDVEETTRGKVGCCNCSKTCIGRGIWQCVITVLVIFCAVYTVYDLYISKTNNQIIVASDSSTISSKDKQFTRAEINWDLIVQSRPHLKVTWKDLSSHFVSLDQTGSIFYVKQNGTYSLSLLLTFDSANNKQQHEDVTTRYQSSVCLKNSRYGRKPSCLRVRLPPNTARTEHITVDVLLFKGDFFWVRASGFDNVYRYHAGNYLTIAKK